MALLCHVLMGVDWMDFYFVEVVLDVWHAWFCILSRPHSCLFFVYDLRLSSPQCEGSMVWQ